MVIAFFLILQSPFGQRKTTSSSISAKRRLSIDKHKYYQSDESYYLPYDSYYHPDEKHELDVSKFKSMKHKHKGHHGQNGKQIYINEKGEVEYKQSEGVTSKCYDNLTKRLLESLTQSSPENSPKSISKRK